MRGKIYDKEFRDSTVQLVLNSRESVTKIAADLDVKPKTIYNWIREYKKVNNIVIETRGTISKTVVNESIEAENRRLRAENRLLRQERDILKKTTAYFAKETL